MAKKVLRTQENEKVVIDRKEDPTLFKAPKNPPNTGTKYTRGRDLYAHKAQSGEVYFYYYDWSMWQGESNSYSLVDRAEAVDFLLDKLGRSGHNSLDEDQAIELDEQYNFGLLQETA